LAGEKEGGRTKGRVPVRGGKSHGPRREGRDRQLVAARGKWFHRVHKYFSPSQGGGEISNTSSRLEKRRGKQPLSDRSLLHFPRGVAFLKKRRWPANRRNSSSALKKGAGNPYWEEEGRKTSPSRKRTLLPCRAPYPCSKGTVDVVFDLGDPLPFLPIGGKESAGHFPPLLKDRGLYPVRNKKKGETQSLIRRPQGRKECRRFLQKRSPKEEGT